MAFSMREPEPSIDVRQPALWLVLWGADDNPLSQVVGAYHDQSAALERAHALIDSGASNVRLGELVEFGDGFSGSNFKVWTITRMNDG
ncbi:MAG: hypothetical protein ACR2P0_07825 [Acidimicrobiales bacterium]